MKATDDHIAKITSSIESCLEVLKKLGDTCCMAERSSRMQTLSTRIEALRDATGASGALSPDRIDAALAGIEEVGAALGTLYATCCTPTRERLYVAMFKSLGGANMALWRLKGVSH